MYLKGLASILGLGFAGDGLPLIFFNIYLIISIHIPHALDYNHILENFLRLSF
jgi:hypothetical protein